MHVRVALLLALLLFFTLSDSISCFPDLTPPKLRNEVTTEQVLASDWNIHVDKLPDCYSYSCDFAIIERCV